MKTSIQKKKAKKLISSLVFLMCFGYSTFAQNVVWTEGFEGLSTGCGTSSGSALTSTNCIPSGWLTSKNYPWIATSSNQYDGDRAIRMSAGWTGWLITAGANLNAGTTYTLSFWYKRSACSNPPCSSGYTVKVGVTQTQTTTPSSTTTVINGGTQSGYTQFFYSYTPTTSGVYYFGLQMSSSINTVYDNGYIDAMSLTYACSTPTAGSISPATSNLCEGSPVVINSTADAAAPNAVLSIEWDRWNYATSTWTSLGQTNSQTLTDNPNEGQYYYRRRVWSDCYANCSPNCIEAVTGTVTVGIPPGTPSFSNGPLSLCVGSNATYAITASGTSPVMTYEILSGGATIDANTGVVSNVTSDFTIRATATNICGVTTVDRSVTVNSLPSVPTITEGGALTFCQGGDVDLTSSYATGNTWSSSENSQVLNITQSGSYSVTYTDANGCESTSIPVIVVVNPNPVPVIFASGTLAFCEGESVELTSSVTTGNVWSTSETTNSIIVSETATITLTATNTNGCTATSSPILVTKNLNPSIPVITANGALTFCEGESVELSSSYSTGNTWSSSQSTQVANITETGSYTVTHTDGNGCSAISFPSIVTVNSNPVALITVNGSINFCEGESVELVSSATSGNLWSTSETTNNIIVDESGVYTLTVTDPNGCSTTSGAAITVVVNPNPVPVITAGGPTTFCAGGNVLLSSSANTGNVWSNNATTHEITANNSGNITVTQTDANGCTGTSAPITITVNTLPTAPVISPVGPISICQGSNVTLTSSATTGNLWSNSATTNSIAVNAAGSFTVTHSDANGCSSTSNPVVVTVNAVPSAGANLSNNITLTATPSGQTYQWINCTNNQPVGGATSVTWTAPSNGSYAVIVTNAQGCKDTSACVVVSKVGLDEITKASGISLYPNPSNGFITVAFESGSTEMFDLVICDASGKIISVLANQVSGKGIDMSSLESGIYFLKIESEKGMSVHRVLMSK